MIASTFIDFWCESGGKHPIVGDVWYRMSTAHGEAADRYSRYLCAALSMMAHTVSDCDVILNRLDAVAIGRSKEEGYGLNDTCVTFRPNGAQVEILIEDESVLTAGRFGLSEYRKVLCGWRDFLAMPDAQESRMRLELP
jgi:hypothetical protein